MAAVHLQTRRAGEPFPADPEALLAYCRDHRGAAAGDDPRPQHPDQRGGPLQLPAALPRRRLGRPPAGADRGRGEPGTAAQPRPLRLRLLRRGAPGTRLRALALLRACGAPAAAADPADRHSRVGIDLSPCRDDEWLRACAFADQPERLERLDAALAIAERAPAPGGRRRRAGAATGADRRGAGRAPRSSSSTPRSSPTCPEGAAERLREIVGRTTYVTAEHTGEHGLFALEIDGERVGTAHPHGRWLDWTGPERVVGDSSAMSHEPNTRRRPQALDRPLRPLHGDADDRRRRDDRQRRPALDQGRPRLLAEQPRLGGQRLPDRLRRAAAALGPARRPDRPAAGVPDRPRRVHHGLAPLRGLAEPGDADRRPLRPGSRRRADLGGDPGDDRDHVPGARPTRRRRSASSASSPPPEDRSVCWPAGVVTEAISWHWIFFINLPIGVATAFLAIRLVEDRGGIGLGAGADIPGALLLTVRADARRLHDPRDHRTRLDLGPHADPRRRSRWPCWSAFVLRQARIPNPLMPLRLFRSRNVAGAQRDPGAAGRRDVRDVLPRRPLHAADPRLRPARRRPRLPAGDDRHGSDVAARLRSPGDALRPPRHPDPQPGADRPRPAALRPHPGGRQLRRPTWCRRWSCSAPAPASASPR